MRGRLLFPIFRYMNLKGSERFSNFSKVAQLESGRAAFDLSLIPDLSFYFCWCRLVDLGQHPAAFRSYTWYLELLLVLFRGPSHARNRTQAYHMQSTHSGALNHLLGKSLTLLKIIYLGAGKSIVYMVLALHICWFDPWHYI